MDDAVSDSDVIRSQRTESPRLINTPADISTNDWNIREWRIFTAYTCKYLQQFEAHSSIIELLQHQMPNAFNRGKSTLENKKNTSRTKTADFRKSERVLKTHFPASHKQRDEKHECERIIRKHQTLVLEEGAAGGGPQASSQGR